MGKCVKMSPKAPNIPSKKKLLSVPKKVNFGPGSGEADLGFHKRALGSNFAGFDAPMQ